MATPRLIVRAPDGVTHAVGPNCVVGRSPAAGLRVDDPRVSSVHAEFSWRAEGFVLLARGGRLTVGGRGERAVVLAEGLRIGLSPGVELEIVAVEGGDAPVVPPTAGRDRLRFVLHGAGVRVYRAAQPEPELELGGVPGRILAEVLDGRGGVAWRAVAEVAWPEDAAVRAAGAWTDVDERRLRNRWDQALVALRSALGPLREGPIVVQRHGAVFVELGPLDAVERA